MIITSKVTSEATVLRLQGSLDIAATVDVLKAVAQAADDDAQNVVCDVSDMLTPSRRLLSVFPVAQHHLGVWPGRELQIAAATPPTCVSMARMGIERFVSVEPTLCHALAMARVASVLRRRCIRFQPALTSPHEAREALKVFLGEAPDWDGAQLVVSELTTNAVRHVQEPFTLHLAVGALELFVGVTDPSRLEPVRRPVRRYATNGRGIGMVAQLSQAWGVRLVHQAGKTVWARLTPLMA